MKQNFSVSWYTILNAAEATNWSHWISLSTNQDWRRIGETGAWHYWDPATVKWTPQGSLKRPSDLIACHSMSLAE